MKAYEMFCQDITENELARSTSDRRTYYRQLREQLRAELTGGESCELLKHLAKRLDAREPVYMYLLDAAVIWECYEGVIDGLRFPRDIAQGMPVPLQDGRRLSWNDVQRLSDKGTLPAVQVDSELSARLKALADFAAAGGKKRPGDVKPDVNPRARLCSVEAREAVAQPAPGKKGFIGAVKEIFTGSGKDDTAKTDESVARLQEQLKKQEEQIARLQNEKEALSAEAEKLRAQPPAAAIDPLMEMILRGKMTEAVAEAGKLNAQVEMKMRELQQARLSVEQLQEQAKETDALLQATKAQMNSLRASLYTAVEEEVAVRVEIESVQTETAARQQERHAAEARLNEARAELSRQNAALRTLQRKLAETDEAASLTRRQVDRLS